MVMSNGSNDTNFPGLDRIFLEEKICKFEEEILLSHLGLSKGN